MASSTVQFHADSLPVTVLARGVSFSSDSPLVADDVRAYWVNNDANGGVLFSLALDGGTPAPVAQASASPFPAVPPSINYLSLADGGVFWSDFVGIHALAESALDAGPRDVVLASQVADAGTLTKLFGLSDQSVVFVETVVNCCDGYVDVWVAPLGGLDAGASPARIGRFNGPAGLSPPRPFELLFDELNAYLFYGSVANREGLVSTMALDGSNATDAGTESFPFYDGVVQGGGRFYGVVATSDGGVAVAFVPVNAPSSNPTVLTQGAVLLVDGTTVYTRNNANIYATDVNDGGTKVFMPLSPFPPIWRLAASSTSILFLSSDGSVMSAPK
jgi:hypothetical protein